MLTTPAEELAEFARNADRLDAALRRFPGNSSSASITFGGERLLSITVALIGFVAVVIAVAAVLVIQAQREADLRSIQQLQHEISGLRERVDIASAYSEQFNRRISKLEGAAK